MEELLMSVFFLSTYLLIFFWGWRKSPASGIFVITGMRLLLAFLLLRCAFAYLLFDTEVEVKFAAMASLAVGMLALLVSQFCIKHLDVGWISANRKDVAKISDVKFVYAVALLFLVGFVLFQGLPSGFYIWKIAGSGEMSDLRREVSKSYLFGGAEYRGQGILRTIIEIFGALLFSTLAVGIISKKTPKKSKILYIALILVVALLLISEGSRGMLMNAVVASICALLFFEPKFKFGKSLVAVLVALTLFFSLSLVTSKSQALRTGEISLTEFSFAIFERLFLSNAINDLYLYELESEGRFQVEPFRWMIRDIKASIPGMDAGKPLAYELYFEKSGDLQGTTYLTGTHMMKAYLDGYYLSVFFQYFLIGFLICFLDKYIARRVVQKARKSDIYIYGFCGAASLFLGLSFITGLTGTMINLVVLLLCFWLVSGSRRFFEIIIRK